MFARIYNLFFNRSSTKMNTTNPDILKNLYEAIADGKIEETVELLKLKEIDVESRYKDDANQTPLHYACKYGYLDIVKVLVDDYKADINAKDSNGDTPLKLSVDNGQPDIAKYIEKKKPKDFEYAKRILNEDIVEEIFVAADTNDIKKVVEILDSKKVDINVTDKSKYHRSLLNAAAMNGHLELVKLLVEKYDAEVNWSDEIGELPIHMAADNGHYEITKYLSEHGSSHVEDVADYLAEGNEES